MNMDIQKLYRVFEKRVFLTYIMGFGAAVFQACIAMGFLYDLSLQDLVILLITCLPAIALTTLVDWSVVQYYLRPIKTLSQKENAEEREINKAFKVLTNWPILTVFRIMVPHLFTFGFLLYFFMEATHSYFKLGISSEHLLWFSPFAFGVVAGHGLFEFLFASEYSGDLIFCFRIRFSDRMDSLRLGKKISLLWQLIITVIILGILPYASLLSTAYINFTFADERFNLSLANLWRLSFWLSGTGALFLIAGGWFLLRGIINPVEAVKRGMAALAKGEENVQIHTSSWAEIGELVEGFNRMSSHMELQKSMIIEQTKRTARLNERLEYLVNERTKELENTLEQLKRTQKQLVESEKMVALGGLVAGIAHEINTPIGIGVTAVSFAADKTNDFKALVEGNKLKKSDVTGFIETISESTRMIEVNLERASELIKSFKQVAADQSNEEKRAFNLHEYIHNVLFSLKPQLKKTNHQITVDCPDNLEIINYPGAFSQVITNFVMNSLIHAYSEEDSGHMSIQIKEENSGIVIEYRDRGRGMAPETKEKIFEPFFTTNRAGGGTGLGLHIVYNIVTQSLGGTIYCESEIGKGTAFIIHLPHKGVTRE